MASITQDMRFRLSLIKYAERHGVSNATRKYKTNRQYIYRWKNRYDGSWDSLRDRSRRFHSHPNQHTLDEIKLILDMRRRNPNAGQAFGFWKASNNNFSKRSHAVRTRSDWSVRKPCTAVSHPASIEVSPVYQV